MKETMVLFYKRLLGRSIVFRVIKLPQRRQWFEVVGNHNDLHFSLDKNEFTYFYEAYSNRE